MWCTSGRTWTQKSKWGCSESKLIKVLDSRDYPHSLYQSFRVTNAFEAHLIGNSRENIKMSLISDNRNEIRLFTSTDELLEEFNSIEEVRLENYRNLFLIYFGFNLLVLVGLTIHKTRTSTIKLLSRFTEILKRHCLTICLRFFQFMLSNLRCFPNQQIIWTWSMIISHFRSDS